MGLRDLEYYDEYVSKSLDLVKAFYIPVLNECVSLDRAVGFFRSNFIYEISKGLASLIEREGKIRIITSPSLTFSDIECINKGYELKKLINEKMLNGMHEPQEIYEKERYNYVAHLIALGKLEIKIAVTKKTEENGIFHEKWGVFKDITGDRISMVGSNNDTYYALNYNHESFELNYSWAAETDLKKIQTKEQRFNKMWNNQDDDLIIVELPDDVKDEILKYKRADFIDENDLNCLYKRKIKEMIIEKNGDYKTDSVKDNPRMPENLNMRKYQEEAYNSWKENGFQGIYNMATGTGKTFTALFSMVKLFEKSKKLFVIIVCPYQHLVEQWVEDLETFNISPNIGYSDAEYANWLNVLRGKVRLFNKGKINFTCFITTNATFSKDYTQDIINSIKNDSLIIVDEVHNIGSTNIVNNLKDIYKYRIGLSATVTRKYDPEGTGKIINFFGGIVYGIGIHDAIFEKKCLVEYDYYPIPTFMNDDEFQSYKKLTITIARNTYKNDKGKIVLNDAAKVAANKRSRLISGIENKLERLFEYLPVFQDKKNNLIYCGATKVEIDQMSEDARQVDYIRKILLENNVNVCKFTADEDVKSRKEIMKEFSDGMISTIVAIKCLDEGVNIPCIERAFILASSKNEKQYIQRRGRVLRKFERDGYVKKKAEIYDFICLPYEINYANSRTSQDIDYGKILVCSELERLDCFYQSCSNKKEVKKYKEELIKNFEVDERGEEEHE